MDDFSKQDKGFLDLAIDLAEKGRGLTSPNPMVGAVIVKDGKLLATGYHKKAGGPHAEIEAIDSAKRKGFDDLAGSDLYVSLEPCSIFGKTPPCTDAIISEGIKSVTVASRDPNPEVSGRGLKKLKNAGIDVKEGLFEERVRSQNEVFFKHIREKSPFVSCKIASSLDGKLATKTASSKWITCEASREKVKKIRSYYDCIITGINTVLADDPMLAFKDPVSIDKRYVRVILDTSLRIPVHSRIIGSADRVATIIFYSKNRSKDKQKIKVLEAHGASVIGVYDESDTIARGLDLKNILKILYADYQVSSVFIESGPTLATSFLKSALIDKFYFFIAPKLIGGDSRFSMFGDLDINDIGESKKLRFSSIENIGSDILLTAYPVI